MKIEIKLNDVCFCAGCPILNDDFEYGSDCNLGYYLIVGSQYVQTQKDKADSWQLLRPRKCIEENGL